MAYTQMVGLSIVYFIMTERIFIARSIKLFSYALKLIAQIIRVYFYLELCTFVIMNSVI